MGAQNKLWYLPCLLFSPRLTGVSPFYDEHLQTMCDNISKVNCDLDADFMTHISTEAKAFMKRLLIREQWYVERDRDLDKVTT